MGRKYPSFPKLFLWLVAINVVLISVAIYNYNGEYNGLFHYFSFAGEYQTAAGDLNILSMIVFSSAMIISGVSLLIFAYRYHRKHGAKKAFFKSIYCSLSGIGFLITGAFPDDINHGIHVFGTGIAIAFLWLMVTTYIVENRKSVRPVVYYPLQSVLQIPIFIYAGTYFMDIEPTSFVLQKVALFGLCIALVSTVFMKKRKFA